MSEKLSNGKLVSAVAGTLGAADTHSLLEVELADRLGASMREIEGLTSTLQNIREKFDYWD